MDIVNLMKQLIRLRLMFPKVNKNPVFQQINMFKIHSIIKQIFVGLNPDFDFLKKFFVLSFLLNGNLTFAQIPNPSNLVGSYQFSGNANDSSGSGNNGVIFGSPSLTADRFNNTNSAYSFDGNDYFYFGNSMSYQINNIFSISLWLNQTSSSQTDLIGLGYQECGSSAGPIIRAGQTMNFNRCNAGFDTTDNTSNDGNWHQFVFVYDGSSRKIYRDGTLLNNLNGGGIFSVNTYGLVLGKAWKNYSGGNYYQGKADDLNIWNVALSANEVSQLYSYENSSPTSNSAPTNITLSSTSVDENTTTGTTVGGLTTTDGDNGDSFTYTLVSGAGGTNNTSFSISGANLLTNTALDYETKSSYNIRVQTSDGTDSYQKAFTINVNDVNEAPTDIGFAGTSSLEYLIVGGGGAGGKGNSNEGGGGGGAGGYLTGTITSIFGETFAVTVGAGGTGVNSTSSPGGNGGNSSLAGQNITTVTALGGGGGGACSSATGSNGASGGGGSGCGTDRPGGSGTTGQGNNGGTGRWVSRSPGNGNGGGGGGSSSAGTNGAIRNAGTIGGGGAGTSNDISGSTTIYTAGGNGGPGRAYGNYNPPNQTGNSGNGGIGGTNYSGGNGANGTVVIRYSGNQIATGGYCYPKWWIHHSLFYPD